LRQFGFELLQAVRQPLHLRDGARLLRPRCLGDALACRVLLGTLRLDLLQQGAVAVVEFGEVVEVHLGPPALQGRAEEAGVGPEQPDVDQPAGEGVAVLSGTARTAARTTTARTTTRRQQPARRPASSPRSP